MFQRHEGVFLRLTFSNVNKKAPLLLLLGCAVSSKAQAYTVQAQRQCLFSDASAIL